MERLLMVPTMLDDVGILEGMRYFVGCTTPSAYQLRLTVAASTIAVPPGAAPAPGRFTIMTLRDGQPLANQEVTLVETGPGVAGAAGTETWVMRLPTGQETDQVSPPTVPMTLHLAATWRAPDGLHHAAATIQWTAAGGSGAAPGSGTSGTPSTPPSETPLAVITGQLVNDSFLFGATCTGPGGTVPVPFVLDTGAFEMLLTESVATALRLPNLGTVDLSGVGGSVQAYQSTVDLALNGHVWLGVPCVVDPTFATNLFGLRWWVDNRLRLLLDPAAATLTVLPPAEA